MRAAAMVLIAVTFVVLVFVVRFAWRVRGLQTAPRKGAPYEQVGS
jgi:hypothetical protein